MPSNTLEVFSKDFLQNLEKFALDKGTSYITCPFVLMKHVVGLNSSEKIQLILDNIKQHLHYHIFDEHFGYSIRIIALDEPNAVLAKLLNFDVVAIQDMLADPENAYVKNIIAPPYHEKWFLEC